MKFSKYSLVLVSLLLVIVLSSSLAAAVAAQPAGALARTATLTPTPTISPTPTTSVQPCVYRWANQALPELTDEIQQKIVRARIQNVTVTAFAFGEDCLSNTGEFISFAAMETDFNVTMRVPTNVNNNETVGKKLRRILLIINQYPPEVTPGPLAGYIDVLVEHGSQNRRLRFKQDAAINAINQGLTGAALIRALTGGN